MLPQRLTRLIVAAAIFTSFLGQIAISSGSVAGASFQDTSSGASPTPAVPPLPLFAIYPKETGPGTFFEVEQDAGSTEQYTVVLVNAGSEENGPFTGRTFAVDGRSKVNGGLESGGPSDPKTGLTSWLDYPNEEFTLDPGKGIERTFSVTVPKDTPPGQYVTALCFETAEPLAVPGVDNVKQNLRQTIAFYLTVPGDVSAEFTIENVNLISEPTWSGLQAEIVNSGNTFVRPEGRLTVYDPDGTPRVTSELSFGAFYAGHTGLIQTGFSDLLPPGDYLVTIELRDPETGATALAKNQQLTTTTRAEITTVDAPPVEFSAASGQIQPNAKSPQFLQIDATISNTGDLITDAELSLTAMRDGELVETYVIVSPLSLPEGTTNVSNRYLPVDGWQTGTWTFTLSIQILNRESGVAQILSTIDLGDPIVIS